jgi:hypothetical protein
MEIIREEIRLCGSENIKIYDLGAGLGGLCLRIARDFPQAEIVGIEMAWPYWLYAFLRRKLSRCGNVRFLLADFWKHDIGDGDIVIFYLGDIAMAAMGEKLQREVKSNRLVISNTFPLPEEWRPLRRIPVQAWLGKEIILYRQK